MINPINKKLDINNFSMKMMIIIVISSSSLLLSLNAFASPRKELLIINSYNESASWVQPYLTTFMKEAAYSESLNCNIAHMNSTLIRDTAFYNKVENGIFERFDGNHPDILVVIGKMAFSLRDRIKQEWGDIPILFLGVDDHVGVNEKYLSADMEYPKSIQVSLSDLRQDYNFTFVEIPDKYRETIDMMTAIQPEMKKLVFASDELVANIELDKKIRSYIAEKYPDIEYEWLIASENSRQDIQSYLTSDDLSYGLLFSSWYYARSSALGYPMLVTGDFRLISSSSHPVFSLKESYLDAGALGGCYADSRTILEKCKSVLLEMCKTGNARNIPFLYSPGYVAKINYDRLKLNDIPESYCPENVLFVNKPKSLWEMYSWLVISLGGLVVAAISVLIVIVSYQRRKMTLMAAHNRLVNNMPICYMVGKVRSDNSGNIVDIDFISGNYEANELFMRNVKGGIHGKLFDIDTLIELLNNMRKEKRNINFRHYFASTDKYYQFQMCSTLNHDEVEFFGVDVTEKEKQDKALVESSKILEMTLAVAHIIPWRWNLKTHLITCEANKVMQHMHIPQRMESDMSVHVIPEDEYFKRIHPEDSDKVKRLYNSLIDGTKQYVKGEIRIFSDSNRNNVDWLEINASVSQCDETGKPEELIGSLLFITERKKQEANLIAAKEAAKESDRLKSAFLANMSHEIRTPLNAIVGFSNLLATTDNIEEKQKFINIIESNNNLLLQLIGDILDLAKVETNTLEFVYKSVDVNDLIRKVEETVRAKVQPGVVLNYMLGAADCYIESEPNRLAQVIINLLTNACKFTTKGSITFGYELRDDDIYFFVKDTGCGISEDGQKHIFQRFAKLNDFVQGTGLGLPISKSIVEKMNGRMGVESKGEGKGSLFWFTIPYRPAVAKKEELRQDEAKEAISGDKITLLVAEDNESNYMLLESILGAHYTLIHAWDGLEAVELFKEHNPKLIIMDINMPKMDGYEATREIRKYSSSVPIIAVTAYAFASDKERIMENGFNSYVSKPINAKRLNEELTTALNNHFVLL